VMIILASMMMSVVAMMMVVGVVITSPLPTLTPPVRYATFWALCP
jgi:hypothetical protein